MITPTSPVFYTMKAEGSAAELITSVFSPSTMCDIVEVLVLSQDYTNDIEPINEMSSAVQIIKDSLVQGNHIQGSVVEETKYNPLFIPMPIEELDEALDVEQKSDRINFGAMDGNPFAVKSCKITSDDGLLLTAFVSYQQFELPHYETIIELQNKALN